MNITVESYGHTVLLHLKGELTEDTLVAVQQSVDRSLAGQEVIDLVFNMETMPFIDSAGLEYLLSLQEKLTERMGQVKLIKPDENIRKILELTRMQSVFETFKDVPEAVRAIHA